MQTIRRTDTLFPGIGAVFCVMLAVLILISGAVPAAAESAEDTLIDDMTGRTQEDLARAAITKLAAEHGELNRITVWRNRLIRGRGKAEDQSGAEPDYAGLVGYAAAFGSEGLIPEAERLNMPWTVPAYTKTDDGWTADRPISHKTPVVVIAQELETTAPGQYTGKLQIIRLDINEITWMDVENFITSPYWFYPARRAVRYGSSIAVYRQAGGRNPVTEDGREVPLKDNTRILVPGPEIPGRERGTPENRQLIPGIAFGVPDDGADTPAVLFFEEGDLTLIY